MKSPNHRKIFLLSAAGVITAFATETEARRGAADGDSLFDSLSGLQCLIREWPSVRLVDLWNGISGAVRIKRFTNRLAGLKRIWDAIQKLEAVHPPKNHARPADGPHTGPRNARSGTKATAAVRGGARVAPQASTWNLKKGGEYWKIAEQVRLSPVPKLGGWAGNQLRFLSLSRGRSVITDVEQGSLAVARRGTGLPSMHGMWFHARGFCLGYSLRPHGSPDPAELFFIDADARPFGQQRLPAPVSEVCAGIAQWFVTCRNGRIYAFSLQGRPQWNERIAPAQRDHDTQALSPLPTSHPRVHLAVHDGVLAVGIEQQLHRYHTSGERLWSETLPLIESSGPLLLSTDLPTRDQRLSNLGLGMFRGRDEVRTGYLRLKFDTLLNAGWQKQIYVSDVARGEGEREAVLPKIAVQLGIGLGLKPGISVVRVSRNAIVAGTQDGLVHVFNHEGGLRRSFQVGKATVSELLVTAEGLKAAYCARRLTLFDGGRVSGMTDLPEYFAELAECRMGVLAWRLRSLWLTEPSGVVQFAAETDRPIRGVWGHGAGFYVLTSELTSFHVRPAGD